MSKKDLRLEYSGYVIFAAKMVSVATGLVFQFMVARALNKTEYDLWFNATTDVIGYFTLMASALPFWAMRFVAREKEGAIKIDIPWKKRARFIQLVHDENITIKSRILSLQKHWDKAANNALVAKAIEVCASKGAKWIMYGRKGNHPMLDNFKQNNGRVKFELTRYYVLLTTKGKIATRLGVHREMKDALPQLIKYRLIPVYNWISRTKTRIKPQRQKLAP